MPGVHTVPVGYSRRHEAATAACRFGFEPKKCRLAGVGPTNNIYTWSLVGKRRIPNSGKGFD